MGCWPIAGMTSLEVTEAESLKTLRAAIECGINFFDTAYCYGRDGESERLIARALGEARDSIVLATKGGIHWDAAGQRVLDGSPQTLIAECEQSLRRLNTDHVDLLYLHAPDPGTPIAESASALAQLMQAGKTRSVGVSNFSVPQLAEFHAVCPITAVQPPYNMLQREIETDLVPWCAARQISIVVYWPLLKGLLAGKLARDHVFSAGDGRPKYPMFQGDEWQRNHDFLDELRAIAADLDRSVAELVVNWTVHQPGITSALCGAKRGYQIEESAAAMSWELSQEALARIDGAIARRGVVISRPAV